MSEKNPERSTPKNRPLIRIVIALLLAAAVSALLPGNRDGVIRQQVIQKVPELAADLGDGPWGLSETDDPACRAGFSEAWKRHQG